MFNPTLTSSLLTLLLAPFSLAMTIADNANLHVHHDSANGKNPATKFTCLPRPQGRDPVQPHLENCAGALRALESDAESAVFHNGPPGDGYQLPTFERYKDCEVLIETVNPGDDPVSSWAEIGLAAMELNMACLGGGSSLYYGGATFCGGGDMVKITLKGTSGRPVGEAPATA
ncbi:MAG: hypothetical protein Q9170_002768 [Blastenia crenularia]